MFEFRSLMGYIHFYKFSCKTIICMAVFLNTHIFVYTINVSKNKRIFHFPNGSNDFSH